MNNMISSEWTGTMAWIFYLLHTKTNVGNSMNWFMMSSEGKPNSVLLYSQGKPHQQICQLLYGVVTHIAKVLELCTLAKCRAFSHMNIYDVSFVYLEPMWINSRIHTAQGKTGTWNPRDWESETNKSFFTSSAFRVQTRIWRCRTSTWEAFPSVHVHLTQSRDGHALFVYPVDNSSFCVRAVVYLCAYVWNEI
jgi:hypothetical protein